MRLAGTTAPSAVFCGLAIVPSSHIRWRSLGVTVLSTEGRSRKLSIIVASSAAMMEREPRMLSKRNLPVAVLLVAVLLVYLNSFGNAFHFDDFHTVTDNPAVRSLGNIPRIFQDTTAFSVLPANQTYRPVVTASLALDYALARGYTPFWFHLSTMFWFLVLVALLYFWPKLLFDGIDPQPANEWLALGVAAWFGLHPAMAETVNYVIQRGDLYCTLGCIGGLYLFARFPAQRRYGIYLVPFVLAMLSKPPAAVFAILLLLYLVFFEEGDRSSAQRWGRNLQAIAPAVAVTIALLWVQSAMTPKSYAPSILSAAAYRLTQPYVWVRYFGAAFLPLHLNVDTDLQPFGAWNSAAIAGLLFAVGFLTTAAYCCRRRKAYPIAFGLLWFVVTQLPTSLYTLSEVENDHRMFFSFPGLMLAVVWALHLGYQRLIEGESQNPARRLMLSRVASAMVVLLLCGYAYGANRRNAVWHDEASLWADDVAKSPHNGRGLMIYGLTRMNTGDYAGALAMFTRASEYTPNYPTLEINLGVVNGLLADSGQSQRTQVAEQHFQRAILLAPNDDLTHAYYGRWLLSHARLPEAAAQLETAVSLNEQRQMQRDLLLTTYSQEGNTVGARHLAETTLAKVPGDAEALAVLNGNLNGVAAPNVVALINASLAAYKAGQFQQSIDEARQAMKLDPRSAEAWNNVGAGYAALHQWDLGIAAEQQALKLNPALTIAANNLRWFESQKTGDGHSGSDQGTRSSNAADYVNLSLQLNQAGKYAESVDAARKALALDPSSAEAWNNVAAGDEAMGKWDEAIDAAHHAIALRPGFELAKNNLAWSVKQKAATSKK